MIKKIIMLIVLLLNLPNIAMTDIYKWTDEQGTIHFSDSPSVLPEDAKKIIGKPDPIKPIIQITPPVFKTSVPQIPEKTKEQREKELNEHVKRVKEESKKRIDAMFSVANEGLVTIRNGLIGLFVSMIGIQILIKIIRQKRK